VDGDDHTAVAVTVREGHMYITSAFGEVGQDAIERGVVATVDVPRSETASTPGSFLNPGVGCPLL
jgi:hypothetical protein